jgi:hypothetical protein
MKRLLLPTILLAAAGISFNLPDVDNRKGYAETVTAADLKRHLSVLASDEYEGRETGERGQKISADYIAAQFKSFGIPALSTGSYFQDVPLISKPAGAGTIKAGDSTFTFRDDFYYTSGIEDGETKASGIVFAGYGIDDSLYTDYVGLEVRGKAVMILADEPMDKNGVSRITKTKTRSAWSTQRRLKIGEARKRGAAAMLVVMPDFRQALADNAHAIDTPTLELLEEDATVGSVYMPVIYISRNMANQLLAIGKQKTNMDKVTKQAKKKAPHFAFNLPVTIDINRVGKIIHSENVLGYLEGSDLKDELIVITAHYDHLGKEGNVVFNGADDDGSGTVAVLELAEAFARAKREGNGPRRSILFMTVTGEEKGLLGSKWYTTHPVFPIANTVCNLNIDMVGRVDEAHKNDSNYVYVIGSEMLSSELKVISEQTNARYSGLSLDYRFDAPNDPNMFYYRSDHYNFAKLGVPVAFYFNGVHADYHKETDEIEKISFSLMEKRTRLVFYTAWELVNRDKRIVVDKKKK